MKAGAGIEHQRGAHRFVLRERAGVVGQGHEQVGHDVEPTAARRPAGSVG